MSWTAERAEEHLLSLELFGMRFGLERMRRLMTVLGSPQRRLRAIHVVGTNGKSSTVRMTAAVLEAHGVRTGAYLSPHLTRFAERIRVGNDDASPGEFGAAVQRAAAAAAKVDRTLPDGERVTQFELLTAAALDELARRDVDVAVVEAGLGGRHDATNVLDAAVVVLTNVGLEHTRWLGPTVADIAREKLAVVKPGATLVVGDVDPVLLEGVQAPIVRTDLTEDWGLGGYQRANFAAARTAAEALQGPLDPVRVRAAAAAITVPGRMQQVSTDPLTLIDGAHNPAGVEALAAALAEVTGRRRLVAVISILDDKDAAGMLRALLGRCEAAVLTASSNPRALSPATLCSLAGQLGFAESHIEPDPRAAVERARTLAGRDGAVVATGSIYLVADLLSAPGARRASSL